jgi:hypothetical protein
MVSSPVDNSPPYSTIVLQVVNATRTIIPAGPFCGGQSIFSVEEWVPSLESLPLHTRTTLRVGLSQM